MAKSKGVGVSQKKDGSWEYRFVIVVNGVTISRKRSTDALGNKLKTKKEAIKAREAAILEAKAERQRKKVISKRKVKEVFEEYREKGCTGKAYNTVLKQDSLWKNHFLEDWGDRFVDEITAAEANDYLSKLYHDYDYAWLIR